MGLRRPLTAVWDKLLRNARMTPDELIFMANHSSIVPAGAHNAIRDFGVDTPSSVHDVGLSFLRVYRRPVLQNLVE